MMEMMMDEVTVELMVILHVVGVQMYPLVAD